MRTVYDNLNIGAVSPVLNSGSALLIVTGPSVDTKGYNSAALRLATTPVTGLPASQQISVSAILQESADGATAWANALDNTGVAIGAIALATTTAIIASARVEGLGLERKRFLRVVTTGGTPTVGQVNQATTSVALIELGRAYNNPVNTTASNT